MEKDLKTMDDFMGAKTRLKAYADDNGYENPAYEAVSKRKEDFRKVYKVRVIIEGLVDITGEGYSRRLAEYWAAINALNEIKEVREEQKKSKEEQEVAKEAKEELRNGVNNSESLNDEEVSNDSSVAKPESKEGSAQQLNGHHNSTEDNGNDTIDNTNGLNDSNSITISADINTSVEVKNEDNKPKVNGHTNGDQSQSSSEGSADNHINNNNDVKEEKPQENGENTIKVQTNGQTAKSEFLCGTTVPTFAPLQKTPVQRLQDFCLDRQSAYPFYDTTYRDRTFLIKCRIEFTEEEEKREFFGTGTGYTSKEAKMMAANDIVQQLIAFGYIM